MWTGRVRRCRSRDLVGSEGLSSDRRRAIENFRLQPRVGTLKTFKTYHIARIICFYNLRAYASRGYF
jgi:hypothetical protein